MTADEIKELAILLNVSLPIILAIIVFIFCITNIDKLLLLISSIQKLFSFCSNKARKGAIANSIRGKVLRTSKILRSFENSLIINDLKIDWVKEEDAETFIKNNQVIIRMSQNSNPHKNYVTAVNTFVNQGLLPKSKNYIDPSILNLSKLTVSRMLVLNGDIDALSYFDETILDPIISSDTSFGETYEELKTIDKNGMFINILLNEYARATQKIYPDTPDPLLIAESKELLNFLYRIAAVGVDDVSLLQFNREYFKIHVFLTAKTLTYKKQGIRPYIKHISHSISQGTETVYMFGLGRKTEIAKEIADELKKTDFRIDYIKPHYYNHRSVKDGHSVRGVCYEIKIYENDE